MQAMQSPNDMKSFLKSIYMKIQGFDSKAAELIGLTDEFNANVRLITFAKRHN